MIEKSIYENYQIDFDDTYNSNDAYYFIFNNNRDLYLVNNNLPNSFEGFDIEFKLYIGKFKTKDVFVINCSEENSFFSLKDVYDIDKDIYLMATRAVLVRD